MGVGKTYDGSGDVSDPANWTPSIIGAIGPPGPIGPEGPEGPNGPPGPTRTAVMLTQAEYDLLDPPDPDTDYFILGGGVVLHGTGAPSSGLGYDDDYYIDNAADTIYGPKTGGAWGSPTSLVGPEGPEGPEGPQGPEGASGPGGGDVMSTRAINTTAPLTGGGNLTADRTLAISDASITAKGAVELATSAETATGTDATRAVTPDSGADTYARVYVHSGGAYAVTGGRIFIGTEDPVADGFTMVDGDIWKSP